VDHEGMHTSNEAGAGGGSNYQVILLKEPMKLKNIIMKIFFENKEFNLIYCPILLWKS
jgi:hypothetical protein